MYLLFLCQRKGNKKYDPNLVMGLNPKALIKLVIGYECSVWFSTAVVQLCSWWLSVSGPRKCFVILILKGSSRELLLDLLPKWMQSSNLFTDIYKAWHLSFISYLPYHHNMWNKKFSFGWKRLKLMFEVIILNVILNDIHLLSHSLINFIFSKLFKHNIQFH